MTHPQWVGYYNLGQEVLWWTLAKGPHINERQTHHADYAHKEGFDLEKVNGKWGKGGGDWPLGTRVAEEEKKETEKER